MRRHGINPFMLVLLTACGGAVVTGFVCEPPLRGWIWSAIAAVFALLLAAGVTFPRMGFFGKVVCRGSAGKIRAALTFDDGPDPDVTPVVLRTLEQNHVRASFFCVGTQVAKHPELAKAIVEEGHVIGNHTLNHGWWTNFLFGPPLRREIEGAQDAIYAATGVAPRYFRSPMGLTNPHLGAALRKAALTFVGWDVRPFDRNRRTPDRVIQHVAAHARDGSIVLLHDANMAPERAEATVQGVITALQDRGYSLVGLDELLEGERNE